MAGKSEIQPVKRRKWRRWLAAALIFVLLGLFGWMFFAANLVFVRYAEVVLPDLPASFDGTTLLYVTDIDLCGVNTARRTAKIFDSLQDLRPDVLLLGGDYTSPNVIERLNGNRGPDAVQRTLLFASLREFQAPMGKFAITGDNDSSSDALKLALKDTGILLIDDMIQPLVRGEDKIGILGAGANASRVSSLAGQVQRGQCVIALAHSPEQLLEMRIAEAIDGGSWADLTLCGHTHGGQLRIAGRNLLRLTDTEEKYLAGWYTDAPSPLLVSTGLGCEAVNLRLSTFPEVWLLTLKAEAG